MFDGSKVKIDENEEISCQELKLGLAASALRLLLVPTRDCNNQKGYSPKDHCFVFSISKIVINLVVTAPPIHTHTCNSPPLPPNTHTHTLASSPGPSQKSGKGPGHTCKLARMCESAYHVIITCLM